METYKDEVIVWPKDIKEEDKEWLLHAVRQQVKEKSYLCVVYIPNCGCPIEQDVVLDRFPMSKKIMTLCPECQKGCLMEISDPIRFYLPMLKEEYSLEDLSKMMIMDGPQRHLIEMYSKLGKKVQE